MGEEVFGLVKLESGCSIMDFEEEIEHIMSISALTGVHS
jgi:hypothetical protein